MDTLKQNLDYDHVLAKCRIFVELMSIYLRCTGRLQEVVNDMIALIGSSEATEEERERAYGTIAGALLAFAVDEKELVGGPPLRLRITPEAKAAMAEQRQTLAKRLRSLRTEKGWTQQELARRSEVGQSAISTLESGRCRPQLATLLKLAEALDVSKEDLWPGPGRPHDTEAGTGKRHANGRPGRGRKGKKRA